MILHRDLARWHDERLKMLGDSPAHRRLWQTLDRLADVFWNATRRGVKLPVRNFDDVWRIATAIAPSDWPLARYARWTGDLLRSLGLRGQKPLCGLLSMLLEDTVHAQLDDAPLINGSLGITRFTLVPKVLLGNEARGTLGTRQGQRRVPLPRAAVLTRE